MKIRLIPLLLLAVLASCATVPRPSQSFASYEKPSTASAAERRFALVGRWYGHIQLKGGGSREWLATRSADGAFRVDFVSTRDEIRSTSTEVGYWGVSGDVYFTFTTGWLEGNDFVPADTTDPTFNDAYQILEIAPDRMTYKNYETGTVYSAARVGKDFAFPPTSA